MIFFKLVTSILNAVGKETFFFCAGCRGAQVEEIWSLEPENFEKLK